MRRSPTNTSNFGKPTARPPNISAPVLPSLKKKRSQERAVRIATKRQLLESVLCPSEAPDGRRAPAARPIKLRGRTSRYQK